MRFHTIFQHCFVFKTSTARYTTTSGSTDTAEHARVIAVCRVGHHGLSCMRSRVVAYHVTLDLTTLSVEPGCLSMFRIGIQRRR